VDIVVVIIFVGALIGIGILISNAAGKNKKSEVIVAKPIETEAKDEDEDEYEDPSHVITPLLKAAKKSNIWICPNCEVENLNSSTRCRMCHYERN
jgi:hypothetical protein